MAFLLGCEKVRVEFPTKTVFDSVSLGVEEGGSGVALDREAYARSVEFWRTHANWRG